MRSVLSETLIFKSFEACWEVFFFAVLRKVSLLNTCNFLPSGTGKVSYLTSFDYKRKFWEARSQPVSGAWRGGSPPSLVSRAAAPRI